MSILGLYWVIIPFSGVVKLAPDRETSNSNRSGTLAWAAGAAALFSALSFVAWRNTSSGKTEAALAPDLEAAGPMRSHPPQIESSRTQVGPVNIADEKEVLDIGALQVPQLPLPVRECQNFYFESGRLMMASEYLVEGGNRIRDGLTVCYYEDSHFEKIRSYWKEGKLDGGWSYSRSDGSVYITIDFRDGAPDGKFFVYGLEGHMLVSGNLKAEGHISLWQANERLLFPESCVDELTSVVNNHKSLAGKVGIWSWYSQNTGAPIITRSYDWSEPDKLISTIP